MFPMNSGNHMEAENSELTIRDAPSEDNSWRSRY